MADDRAPGVVVTSPDPTTNVRELVVAEHTRNDDLRLAESLRVNQAIEAIRREAELRSVYEGQLREAEANRLNAIRAVDVNAVQVAASGADARASVLANQLTTSADALRNLVATTAATVASQLSNITQQFTDRLALLERAQYEGQGKSTVTDPMVASLAVKMDHLIAAMSEGKGRAGLSTPVIATLCGVGGAAALFLLEHGIGK